MKFEKASVTLDSYGYDMQIVIHFTDNSYGIPVGRQVSMSVDEWISMKEEIDRLIGKVE